jgi:hypothetical protein
MELHKLKSKLKANGIELTTSNENISFTPIKLSQLKFILLALLFLPALFIFLVITGPSILGILTIGAGFSCLYHGVKSYSEARSFNSSSFIINQSEIIIPQRTIPLQHVKRFKADRTTNPLFYNIAIIAETDNEEIEVIKIWGSNKKHLNEDKYEIIQGLNNLRDTTINELQTDQ